MKKCIGGYGSGQAVGVDELIYYMFGDRHRQKPDPDRRYDRIYIGGDYGQAERKRHSKLLDLIDTGRGFPDLENITTVAAKPENRRVRQNMRKTWLSS